MQLDEEHLNDDATDATEASEATEAGTAMANEGQAGDPPVQATEEAPVSTITETEDEPIMEEPPSEEG